jgi:type II secretory pathway predicted ATPase ExeA/septal ring-binding cell division protein DamX
MYLSHFGLSEPPFRITPHTDFFFDGANRGATLEALLYAITHDEGIVKVSGEVGSGKTMLCRVLMERLPQEVETIYLANPSLSREEILYAIADELRLELSAERAGRLLRELQDQLLSMFAKGKRVVVLIDEAHAMPKETLEEIRLLSNLESGHHKLLQIVLFGQPELDELLGSNDMRQLKERITHSFRLEPFVTGDIETYIDFRMRAAGYRGPRVFTSRAVRMIAAASQGLTRRVNILADKALLSAFARNTHGVTDKEARAAIRDSDFYKPQAGLKRFWLAAATLLIGLVVGFTWERLWHQSTMPDGAPSVPGKNPAASEQHPVASPGATVESSVSVNTAVPAPASQQATAPLAEAPARPQKAESPAPTKSEGRIHPLTPSAESPAPVTPAITADATQDGPAPPGSGKLAMQVFSATQAWLKSAPKDGYSLQLITVRASEIAKMEKFLQRAAKVVPVDELHLYSVKIDGVQHYRAAFGLYRDNRELSNAINDLPDALRSQNPYKRSIERMQSQNRQ